MIYFLFTKVKLVSLHWGFSIRILSYSHSYISESLFFKYENMTKYILASNLELRSWVNSILIFKNVHFMLVKRSIQSCGWDSISDCKL